MDQLVFAHWEGNDAPPVCEVNPLVHPTHNIQDNHRLFYLEIGNSLRQGQPFNIALEDGVSILALVKKMMKG
jgi:hypothetical protein